MKWYHYIFGFPALMILGWLVMAYFLITAIPILLPLAIFAAPVQVWCDITGQNVYLKPWYVKIWVIPFMEAHKWYIKIFFFGMKQINTQKESAQLQLGSPV